MRTHTTLRTAFRMGMFASVAAGALFVAADAHADTVSSGPYESNGGAALYYEHTEGLDTSIAADYKGQIKPGGVEINFSIGALVKIEPVKGDGKLFIIDMKNGANVRANWGDDKKIKLSTPDGGGVDGAVKVRHTLSPTLRGSIAVPSMNLNFGINYDATTLLKYIPGGKFNYDSSAVQSFAPWGYNKVDTTLTAPDLSKSVLFSFDFKQLPDFAEFVKKNAKGEIGIRARTNPTFSYKTTKTTLQGADGTISDALGELTVPAVDGDYMEIPVQAEGTMDVVGKMAVEPYILLMEIGSFNFAPNGFSFGIPVVNVDYKVKTIPITYQTVIAHIPLPNVRLPKNENLGEVKQGSSAKKTITIDNTGEKDAVFTLNSSDTQFTVSGENFQIPAKGSKDIVVEFAPVTDGPALSEITISSNDPDSPYQTFKVGANGANVDPDAEPQDGQVNADSDSGCGCKAAGSSSTVPSWAGIGLIGLGAAVMVRRRRNAA